MKIVIIGNLTRSLHNFRGELIEVLAKDHDVTILSSGKDRADMLRDMGCQFIEIPIERHGTNPVKELKLYGLYKKQLKKLNPDVVLTYSIKPNIYGGMACATLGIHYIANITGLGTAIENGGLMQKPMLMLYKYGLRKAKKVFFQNKSNMEYMISKGIVRGPYELIPGSGVNLERYKLLDYPKGETVDFTYIGRVMKQKGIDQYLEAAKVIREQYPETRFHICGGCDSEYRELIKELNKNGTIIYHGIINDISSMHAISRCTIHPTYYPEGMSNVLLESCACGRPVITTDRPGCREVVDNGVNGFLIKQRDSQDLIEKIKHFLGLEWETCRQMGLAGRAKVEREFDRQIVVRKYLEEIR